MNYVVDRLNEVLPVLLTLGLCLSVSVVANAQGVDENGYVVVDAGGGFAYEDIRVNDLVTLSSGSNYSVAIGTVGNNVQSTDNTGGYVAILDEDGEVLQNAVYVVVCPEGQADMLLNAGVVMPGGELVVTGAVQQCGSADWDVIAFEVDVDVSNPSASTMSVGWKTTIDNGITTGEALYDEGTALTVAYDQNEQVEGVVIVGGVGGAQSVDGCPVRVQSTVLGGNLFYAKLSTTGGLVWFNSYTATLDRQVCEGEVWGLVGPVSLAWAYGVTRVDIDGDGSDKDDQTYVLVAAQSDPMYLEGYGPEPPIGGCWECMGDENMLVAQIKDNGVGYTENWRRIHGPSSLSTGEGGIRPTSVTSWDEDGDGARDDGVVVGGYVQTVSAAAILDDMYIAAIDPSGAVNHSVVYDAQCNEVLWDVEQVQDEIVGVGHRIDLTGGVYNATVLTVDASTMAPIDYYQTPSDYSDVFTGSYSDQGVLSVAGVTDRFSGSEDKLIFDYGILRNDEYGCDCLIPVEVSSDDFGVNWEAWPYAEYDIEVIGSDPVSRYFVNVEKSSPCPTCGVEEGLESQGVYGITFDRGYAVSPVSDSKTMIGGVLMNESEQPHSLWPSRTTDLGMYDCDHLNNVDVLVFQINSWGHDMVWRKKYFEADPVTGLPMGSWDETVHSVAPSPDEGGVFIGNISRSNWVGAEGCWRDSNIYIIKILSDGSVGWLNRTFIWGIDRGFDVGTSIVVSDDDLDGEHEINEGYVFSGYSDAYKRLSETAPVNHDGVVGKINSQGFDVWLYEYGFVNDLLNKDDRLFDVKPMDYDGDGVQGDAFIAVGYTKSPFSGKSSAASDNDIWALAVDASGQVLWSTVYRTDADEQAAAVVPVDWDDDGNQDGFAITGDVNYSGQTLDEMFVINIDNAGGVVWANLYTQTSSYAGVEDFGGIDLAFDARDGKLAVVGNGMTSDEGPQGTILKLDDCGDVFFSRDYPDVDPSMEMSQEGAEDHIDELYVDVNGDLVAFGSTCSFGIPNSPQSLDKGEFYLVRFPCRLDVCLSREFAVTSSVYDVDEYDITTEIYRMQLTHGDEGWATGQEGGYERVLCGEFSPEQGVSPPVEQQSTNKGRRHPFFE